MYNRFDTISTLNTTTDEQTEMSHHYCTDGRLRFFCGLTVSAGVSGRAGSTDGGSISGFSFATETS